MPSQLTLVVLTMLTTVATPATLRRVATASSSSGGGTLLFVVLVTLLVVLLLVAGVVILSCHRYRGNAEMKQDLDCPIDCMSTTSQRGQAFLSSVFLQELKTQHPAISVGDLTSTAVLPSATTAMRLQQSTATTSRLQSLADIRSSELCRTGLGSVDDRSSIMESSSNILGSIRTEQTLSSSSVLSTFLSHETTSLDGMSTFRSQDTSSVDDGVVVISGGRHSDLCDQEQQHVSDPDSTESEGEGISFHDAPSPWSILQEDVTIFRPHMSDLTSSSRGLNQLEYYQWARAIVANGGV
ncbi:hypothetical protein H310_03885 [Aphanomyces invadans]|uniref:Membrane-associated protein n=1 Tax=Aphanomyces invadans TaxID=157072 RepID=A0A024UE96_9STRA|nr:hypothetical protein H310_03885 [Aphanomyces invadans]ETW04736.1 hypothetical protein H310_03885 [Aphanomyces invadans]|eukprot:XP_008866174.1 hypothetical protein H310_03885 [Aphanomyces invadans]